MTQALERVRQVSPSNTQGRSQGCELMLQTTHLCFQLAARRKKIITIELVPRTQGRLEPLSVALDCRVKPGYDRKG